MGRGRRGNSGKKPAAGELESSTSTHVDALRPTAPQQSQRGAVAPPPRKRQKREEYRHSINTDESRSAELPKKKWFRQRAHANPFSDHRLSYPVGPDQMDWSKHYPAFVAPSAQAVDVLEAPKKNGADGPEDDSIQHTKAPKPLVKNVEIADIGCGYGGLLFALAPKLPDTLILGLEIRTSITEFVDSKIRALRHQSAAASTTTAAAPQHTELTPAPPADQPTANTTNTNPPVPAPGHYQNIATLRTNSMKFLPNLFARGSLRAIFLCFPDPHFKNRKHKARIVSSALNAEYAYALRPGGRVYTITDVEELAGWMRERFDAHPAFERVLIGVEEAAAEPAEGGERRVWREEKANAGEADSEDEWLVKLMRESTEEGKKVERFGGKKFVGVWRRLRDPAWPGEGDGSDA